MRFAFLSLVLIHGLIHLIGFVKGFELKEVKELSLPVSKSVGLLWLTATLLFLVFGIMHFTNSKFSWVAGFAAVMFSQFLIFEYWKDAKFGTIPNVIILIVALVNCGYFLIKNDFAALVKFDLSNNNSSSTEQITEEDMAHLPAIVKKYVHYTKSAGKPKIKNFRAEFTGGIRFKPEDEYMKFRSVQYNFYENPSRYFFMEVEKIGLPATGLHIYKNNSASFKVKMMNWFNVVDAKGELLNQAETVTLFNDMCCIAPGTLIDKRISWEKINELTVKGILKNGNITISAILYFNEDGALINFISNDRYETDGKTYTNYPWSTPLQNYRMINGYFLPGNAKLIYQKPGGDFTYGEFTYESIKCNLDEFDD